MTIIWPQDNDDDRFADECGACGHRRDDHAPDKGAGTFPCAASEFCACPNFAEVKND